MIIAIDGPAGGGKSTRAAALAQKLGLINLNSGNFYRAIAYRARSRWGENFLSDKGEEDIVRLSKDLNLEQAESGMLIDGQSVTNEELHAKEMDILTSKFSAIIEVRKAVNEKLRSFARGKNVVCEGRDITSVVFPQADYKFYLDCSALVRSQRRANQWGKPEMAHSLLKEIEMRDRVDKAKPFGALVLVPDAKYIDTTSLTESEVLNIVLSIICFP